MKTTSQPPVTDELTTIVPVTTSQNQPHFIITNIPDTVNAYVGEVFNICATIKNDGASSGTYRAELYNEQNMLVDQDENTLDAGQDVIQCLHDQKGEPGTYVYTYKVYNEQTGQYDDQATVTVNVQSKPPTTSTTKTSKMGFGWLLILILLLLLLGGSKK